jgi:plasmid stabilization system protein ParE
MKVRYTRRAQGDLAAILRYLKERSPQGSRNVRRAVRKAIELIGEHPFIDRPAGE